MKKTIQAIVTIAIIIAILLIGNKFLDKKIDDSCDENVGYSQGFNMKSQGEDRATITVGVIASTSTYPSATSTFTRFCNYIGTGTVRIIHDNSTTGIPTIADHEGIRISSSTTGDPCYEMYPEKFIWNGPNYLIADATTDISVESY